MTGPTLRPSGLPRDASSDPTRHWRDSCVNLSMNEALRIVVVAPDLAIADQSDDYAVS